jgi:hypothetical protein
MCYRGRRRKLPGYIHVGVEPRRYALVGEFVGIAGLLYKYERRIEVTSSQPSYASRPDSNRQRMDNLRNTPWILHQACRLLLGL